MKIHISTFITLLCLLNPSAESKEAAYVTVADESGYTQIAVIDVNNPQIVKYIPIGPNALGGNLIQTPNGKSLFLAGYRANTIYQIDIATDIVVDSMSISGSRHIAVSPDGQYLFCSGRNSNKILIIDWPRKQIVYEIEGDLNFASEIIITSDGKLAYLRGTDMITIVDIATKQTIQNISIDGVKSLLWHKRNGLLYAIGEGNKTIVKIDPSTHKVVGHIQLNLEGSLRQIRFNCCEDLLYATTDIEYHIVDLITETTISRIPSSPVQSSSDRMPIASDIAFTPNAKQVYLTKTLSRGIDFGASSTPGQVWMISTTQNVILYKLSIGFEPDDIAMVVFPPLLSGDFNSDQRIDFSDFILFASVFGTTIEHENWSCDYDLILNGKVDFADFIKFAQLFNGG